jgi:hypothetical protein
MRVKYFKGDIILRPETEFEAGFIKGVLEGKDINIKENWTSLDFKEEDMSFKDDCGQYKVIRLNIKETSNDN